MHMENQKRVTSNGARATINILGIETSCDETAAAVVADGKIIKSSIVATQTKLHEKYGGVVPEVASRAHIEKIYPVIAEAISQAGLSGKEIDAIAVADRPGLTIALIVGVTAAKTLSFAWLRLQVSARTETSWQDHRRRRRRGLR
jgi:N6-L-threonylcarbamoyladenine synthase